MRYVALLLCALVLGPGCQHVQLRNRTARQAATLTDLQYQEVLNNLAMFAAEPDTIPHYALANKGTTTVTNTATVGGTLGWNYQFLGMAGKFVNHLDKKTLAPQASQQSVETWNTDSILNPDKLFLMRCAYQRAVGHDAGCSGAECDAVLTAFFKPNPAGLAALRPGWFGVGRLRDVPKGACHVGHYHHTYVWVTPDGADQLAMFTLAILDIATALDTAVVVITPEQLKEAAIRGTIERLKTMTDIYKGLPEGDVTEKEAKARFEARLLAELDKLEVLYGPGSPEEKAAKYQARLKQTLDKSRLFNQKNAFTVDRKAFTDERVQEFKELVAPPPPTPGLRPRREFNTFPLPPNVIPQP